jgi:large conductance mechanosensitive channel
MATIKPSEQTDTHIVTGQHGDVHITQPKVQGKHAPKITVLVAPDDFAREQVGGFVNFLRQYAVVGLAVGFIVGLQAQTVMKQLVESFITPMLNFLLGQDLMKKQFTIGSGASAAAFTWGKFIYALVNFLFVLLFIYLIVKLLKLDKLDKVKS